MSRKNAWSETFGAFYSETSLERHGIKPDGYLISIHTTEGDVLYPHLQFRATGQIEPGTAKLEPRSRGLGLWRRYLIPAIAEGIIDEYTAASLFVGRSILKPGEPSLIEEIDSRDTTELRQTTIEHNLWESVSRWRE